MKEKLLLILLAFVSALSFEANGCEILIPNSSTKLITSTTSKCINIKHINPSKTYIVADSSFQNNADYRIKIKAVTGETILDKKQLAGASNTSLKLNTNYNSEIRLTVEPLTSNRDYEFYVIHDENTTIGETNLYIGLHSKVVITSPPPIDPPVCPNCQPYSTAPMLSSLSVESSAYSTMQTTSEAVIPQKNLQRAGKQGKNLILMVF